MTNKVKFHGIIPPVSTIFTDKGDLDQAGMGELIDYLIGSGVDGLFFLGSGGEFSQMSVEERKTITSFVTEYVDKRVPVLIGTGSPSTRESIELTKYSQEAGADAVVIINPYYWALSKENLFNHYSTIAESVAIPILLYNFPGLTGQDLDPEFVLKLAQKHENIVGIKETIDEMGHIREMILKLKEERPDFCILSGYDDHLLNTLSLGGDGAISASVNFAPELQVGIYQAFKNNDFETAIELHRRLAYLPIIYKLDAPFVNVVKEAIRLRGKINISTYTLPPASTLSEDKIAQLKAVLKKAHLI